MKKIILSFGIAAFMLASCGDGTMSVTDYNQKAISIYNPLQMRMNSLSNSMGSNKADMTTVVEATAKSIDSARTEIAKLKPNKDAQEMHNSLIALLDYEKDKMIPAVKKLISKMDNPAELLAAAEEVKKITEESTVLEQKMTTAQAAMAAKAGASLH